MAEFPHLPLKAVLNGNYKFKGFAGAKKSARSLENLKNPSIHGTRLGKSVNAVENLRKDILDWREEQGLPDLPDKMVTPVLLEVDPNVFDIEALKGFGIEIIAEEENGYIIGASVDQFKSLREKIEQFIKQENIGTALLWDIADGQQWRPEYILSEELYEKWLQGIDDNAVFTVDISVACYIKKSPQPVPKDGQSTKNYKKSLDKWYEKSLQTDAESELLMMNRQSQIQEFIELGGGNLVDGFIEYQDSFGFRAEMNGLALKDLVLNYQYVFEVAEHSDIESNVLTHEHEGELDVTINPPDESSPIVCVIDSGIQENHLLLEPAVLQNRSISFVPNDASTADGVNNGGHGTKVAGAILYSGNIPKAGNHSAPFFLANARVLDNQKSLSSRLFEPNLMDQILDYFGDVSIFNLSINKWIACRKRHMSLWASAIDAISHENNKVFVISTGNLATNSMRPNRPGIQNHLDAGRNYPDFLLEESSRIADPAQSMFAITVGSVCLDGFSDSDVESFGKKNYPSSFSRSGLGMWGAIKPEVVEYGGDWVKERAGNNFSLRDASTPELVKTGMHGVGRCDIGSSFSAPRVSHIIAHLQKLFPSESPLFHKALLIQSARLPQQIFDNPQARHLRYMGYGIPNLDRAIDNTPYRITFTESGTIGPKKAKIFTVKVPEELRRQGESFDILVEVSLCYTAEPRRTRQRLRSYLSSWLTWESSKLGQSTESFQHEVLKELESEDNTEEIEEPADPQSIRWSIWGNTKWGKIKDIRRQASANQKDWVVLKSYNLSPEISFALIGHQGWEKDLGKEIPYSLIVSFEILGAEVELYEIMQKVNIEVPIEVKA